MDDRGDRARAAFVRAAEALEFPRRPSEAVIWAVLGLVHLHYVRGAPEAAAMWERRAREEPSDG